jgi:hypothetical protein
VRSPFDRGELALYFGSVLQLAVPGHSFDTPDTYGGQQPGSLDDWSDAQLELLLNEGRRHLAELNEHFEVIRTRGQWLFTTLLALLVFVASQLGSLADRHGALLACWYLGALLLVIALLGSAAVFLTTAQLGSVDVVMLTAESPTQNILAVLAGAYPDAVITSGNTVRLRFTILRNAMWFAVLGILIEAITWVVLVSTAK